MPVGYSSPPRNFVSTDRHINLEPRRHWSFGGAKARKKSDEGWTFGDCWKFISCFGINFNFFYWEIFVNWGLKADLRGPDRRGLCVFFFSRVKDGNVKIGSQWSCRGLHFSRTFFMGKGWDNYKGYGDPVQNVGLSDLGFSRFLETN